MKKTILAMSALMMGLAFTACSDSDNNEENNNLFSVIMTTPQVDQDSYASNTNAAQTADCCSWQHWCSMHSCPDPPVVSS